MKCDITTMKVNKMPPCHEEIVLVFKIWLYRLYGRYDYCDRLVNLWEGAKRPNNLDKTEMLPDNYGAKVTIKTRFFLYEDITLLVLFVIMLHLALIQCWLAMLLIPSASMLIYLIQWPCDCFDTVVLRKFLFTH